MNEMTTIAAKPQQEEFQGKGGMNAEQAAYMRGGLEPVSGSVPMSTSKYLNSPLYVHAYSTMSLRRMGPDVACTYDIPTMSRALADVADYAEAARLIAEEKAKNPAFASWVDRRSPPRIDPKDFKDSAEGTFGAAMRAFVAQGFKLDFVHNYDAKTDLEYVTKAIGHSHDIQHIVTGFGPNMAGEHALAIMNITSTYKHLTPELAGTLCMANHFVSWSMLTRVSLHYRDGMPIILEATRLGIEAGEALKTPLFMVDWADYYDWTLEDLAAHLGIKRGPGEAWAYTEELCTG